MQRVDGEVSLNCCCHAQDQSMPAGQQVAQAPAPGLPAGQAAATPAPATLVTRLVPARMPGAITLAPAVALPAGQAITPAAATQLVPGIVEGPMVAQASPD